MSDGCIISPTEANLTICDSLYSANWIQVNPDGNLVSSGTLTFPSGSTPEVRQYVAVLAVWNSSDLWSGYIGIATFVFDTASTNTLTLVSPLPLVFGAVFTWTAPKFHMSNDFIKATQTNCTPTIGNDYCELTGLRTYVAFYGQSTGNVHLSFTGIPVGTTFWLEYHVGALGVLTFTTTNFTVVSVNGTCAVGCLNAGSSCADGTACDSCTVNDCEWPDAPVLSDRQGQTSSSAIRLLGDTGISFDIVVQAPNLAQIQIFSEFIPAGSTIVQSSTNATIFTFTWNLAPTVEASTYYFSFWAVDRLGRVSNWYYFALELREEYCSISGDPHFISFDGAYFDFQGAGDFVVLEAHDPLLQMSTCAHTFALQARFEDCGSGVTCTSAAAISSLNGTASLVRNYTDAAGWEWFLVVQQNGVDVIASVPYNFTYNGERIGSVSLSGSEFNFDFRQCAGATVRVDTGGAIMVTVTSTWAGRTLGLCGTFNGDWTDDYTVPNGTMVFNASSASATPENIYYQFGMEYHVAEADSFFNYSLFATNYSQENPPAWTPVFVPTFETPEIEATATLMCENLPGALQAEINACKFDVAAGGSGAAFLSLGAVMSRCYLETDGSTCASPSGCGSQWCNLAGDCLDDGQGGHSCSCANGYAPPDCTPITSSSKVQPSSHAPNPRASSHTENQLSGAAGKVPFIVATILVALIAAH